MNQGLCKRDFQLRVLGLGPGATLSEVKTAYRDCCRAFHPDRLAGTELYTSGEEQMKSVNAAYAWLVENAELLRVNEPVRRSTSKYKITEDDVSSTRTPSGDAPSWERRTGNGPRAGGASDSGGTSSGTRNGEKHATAVSSADEGQPSDSNAGHDGLPGVRVDPAVPVRKGPGGLAGILLVAAAIAIGGVVVVGGKGREPVGGSPGTEPANRTKTVSRQAASLEGFVGTDKPKWPAEVPTSPPSEKRQATGDGIVRPDLSRLTSEEREWVEEKCASLRESGGLASYYTCIRVYVQDLQIDKRPDLSPVSADDRARIESACESRRRLLGLPPYYDCVRYQLQLLARFSDVSFSGLTDEEIAIIRDYCRRKEARHGPGDMAKCLSEEVGRLRSAR